MKTVKLIGAYILAGAATAIGWKTVEKMSDPYERALLKQKLKKKFKKTK
jgi:hypothetical protein